MNRKQLIQALASELGVTVKKGGAMLLTMFDLIAVELKKGKNVTITGVGTFRVSHRKAREGVDPRDPKKRIKIPASKIAAFTCGKQFREKIQ